MPTKITKWYTINEYVDIDTGEMLTKEWVNQQWVIINKHKKTDINEKMATAIIRYLNECKQKPATQGNIFE